MGWIHDKKMRTGVHLAYGSEVGRRAGILRKIVGVIELEGMEYERLECGHRGRLYCSVGTGGLFGVQEAESRRCMECKKKLK